MTGLQRSSLFLIPAKAGIRLSAAGVVETWIPTFAGMASQLAQRLGYA